MVIVVVVVVRSSAASSLGPRGIGAPCRGRWAVSAGASLGRVMGDGGYVRGVVLILGRRSVLGTGAGRRRGTAVVMGDVVLGSGGGTVEA